ncbi:PIR Superfamily Protein [Plasmodium ovale wallikeri]|uniref:PIR Superfamily Protein n=1 Tax=Plasmodium ovale wallikeri TaxID=864142 RepID=A0A1A9AIU5_PLAOA|nr:PIR Superfamily Protein [Plasmodium ovale wallikeri]
MVDPASLHPLDSNKIYDMLETKNLQEGDREKCEELDQIIKNQYQDSDSLTYICQSFTGNLLNYENIKFSDFFDKFRCIFLNIWLYEYLLKEKINWSDLKYSFIKGRIVKFWNEYDFKNTCDYDFIYYSNKVDYDRMKKMYEFALNYEKLYFFIKTSNDPCTTEDEQYIQESHKLYEEVKSECESELDPEPEPEPEFSSKYITKRIHCDALKDIYSFYSKSKLSELKCTTTIYISTRS